MYEIEIKSLLGSKERAEEAKKKLAEKDKSLTKKGEHKQLNHYFNVPSQAAQGIAAATNAAHANGGKILSKVCEIIGPLVAEDKKEALKKICEEGKKVSIRTRDADGKVYFVMKASVGDDTSANGVSRVEFQEEVFKTLDELDKILLDAGLTYQAKWSREREEYESKTHNMQITIDKNAGYGYLAEFEKSGKEGDDVKMIEKEIRDFMGEIGVEELAQDRLERMFEFYNEHWAEYYGTDKVFTIE
ncbi:MAG: hypothetical protein Q8P86_03285 [bacterium]|nr:hypothetical protein [bacterium]